MKHFMTGNNGRGFVIQERDQRLLRELALMRVIDREQAKLVAGFGSTTRTNARLLALTRAGLLRRFFLGTSAGGRKALYALSRRGAHFVEVPYRGLRRPKNQLIVIDSFVFHQMVVNRLYCAFRYRPISIPGAEFIRWKSFLGPVAPGIPLIPDGYVEVKSPEAAISAFLEVDLGQEGLSVWRAKVRNYLRYALSGDFERQFRQPRFRVLVVCISERRLESIRRVVDALTEKLFWFATLDSIDGDGLWSPAWLRSRDDSRYSLL